LEKNPKHRFERKNPLLKKIKHRLKKKLCKKNQRETFAKKEFESPFKKNPK
jgi:hypothetical protein